MTAALLDPVTSAEYYYDYAGDDPINNVDPSGMGILSNIKNAAISVGEGVLGLAEASAGIEGASICFGGVAAAFGESGGLSLAAVPACLALGGGGLTLGAIEPRESVRHFRRIG